MRVEKFTLIAEDGCEMAVYFTQENPGGPVKVQSIRQLENTKGSVRAAGILELFYPDGKRDELVLDLLNIDYVRIK